MGTGDKVASLFPGLESLMATALGLACALCFVTITEYSWSMFKEASEVGQCTFVRFFVVVVGCFFCCCSVISFVTITAK